MTSPQDARSKTIDRRLFLQDAAVVAGTGVSRSLYTVQAAEQPLVNHPVSEKNKQTTIDIQGDAVSFVDEGVEPMLDIFQQKGQVDTLFLATFT